MNSPNVNSPLGGSPNRGGPEVGVEVKGVGDEENSIGSLAVDFLPLVEKVRVTLTLATSNSL